MPFRFNPKARLDPSQVEDLRGGWRAWQDLQRLLKTMEANIYQARNPHKRIRRYEDGSYSVLDLKVVRRHRRKRKNR